MKRGPSRRAIRVGAALCCAVLTVAVARTLSARYARRYAERSALGIAAYLALVTRPSADRSDYDLGQLLVRARGLDLIPEWVSQVEVYHGTAPLVRATAGALPPTTLDRLRRLQTIEWRGGDVLVPLTDRDRWDVVGAVAVRIPELSPAWARAWSTLALLLTLAALVAYLRAAPRGEDARARALSFYWVASLALGIGAALDAGQAAQRGTDRWLAATRTLVQEAARSWARPTSADLAPAVRGGAIVPRDSNGEDSRRARIPVRLRAGRWAELRTAEPETRVWTLVLVALALLGPALVSVGLPRPPAPDGAVSVS